MLFRVVLAYERGLIEARPGSNHQTTQYNVTYITHLGIVACVSLYLKGINLITENNTH